MLELKDRPELTFPMSGRVDPAAGKRARQINRGSVVLRGTSDHWIDYYVDFPSAFVKVRVYYYREVVPYSAECRYGRAHAKRLARRALGFHPCTMATACEPHDWSDSIDDLMH